MSKLLIAVFTILSRLPLAVLQAIGSALGWIVYLSSPGYAARMRQNLAQSGMASDPQHSQTLLRQAIRAADFRSVRGAFRFGVNHYPVQDFWLCQVARRPDGKFQTETVRKVFESNVDPWAAECRMR